MAIQAIQAIPMVSQANLGPRGASKNAPTAPNGASRNT